MRKLFISFILTTGFLTATFAQTDRRTRETKIADIIMQLPAGNTASYNRLMGELSGLGDVIVDLVPRLADPGGNDAQIRHAIGGLTMYASRNASLKTTVAKNLCTAISAAKSDEIRDFLFIQLQYVAGEESVETAAQYLNSVRLADAAARVLVRIGTDAAGKALLNALDRPNSNAPNIASTQKISVVEALGDMRYEPAATTIEELTAISDVKLRKAVLYALAQIGASSSKEFLALAAQNTGYRYEPTDALGSYVKYLYRIYEWRGPDSQFNSEDIAKMARTLLKSTSEMATGASASSQIAAKSAALELVVRCDPEKADKDILKALKSDSKQYRMAALMYAVSIWDDELCNDLLKAARKEKRAEVKAEIIAALGEHGNEAALPFVYECLTDTGAGIRAAAIVAVARLDGVKSVYPITQTMNTNDVQVIAAGKNTLLTIAGNAVTEEAAKAIPQTSAPAKIAFMEIIATRRDTGKADVIFTQTSSADASVRLAAYKALAAVVSEKDLPRVAQLLSAASNREDIAALQQAMFATVSGQSQSRQTELVAGQAASSGNPAVYGNVLAMIGGEEALNLVIEYGILSDEATIREAAFRALLNWSDDLATPWLYKLISGDSPGTDFNEVFSAYINKVARSGNTPEQKVIMLRNALEIAKTPAQKQTVLRQITRTGTFAALITAGKYLDDTSDNVRQAAVQAVRTIALAHTEYYGSEVTALLDRAMAVNTDPEANYQRQEILKHIAALPADEGFVSMFNGKDLTGWKGLVEDPIARAKMTPKQLADKQIKADEIMRRDWSVHNGILVFDGPAYDNLCSLKDYGDFEMYVDWRISAKGDAGVYLRGSPQVQIWDIPQTGSGGLFNNQKNAKNPLVVADNPTGEWNSFHIKMVGDKVTVHLNGQLVADNVVLENYWDRKIPIFETGAIELQAHGDRVEWRDIYVREIPRLEPYRVSDAEAAEGFVPMFNGIDMTGWTGNLTDYSASSGMIICSPSTEAHGNLLTDREYANFVMRFEFQLTPAANNGLGVRIPTTGDAAYGGMELQILDNEAEVYSSLAPYQYHGSVYGVIAAKRGHLKPTGEWNTQEVTASGNRIKVVLNGTVIVDGDLSEASKNFTQTLDGVPHPGLANKSGRIGFLGHDSKVAFRNIRIKEL